MDYLDKIFLKNFFILFLILAYLQAPPTWAHNLMDEKIISLSGQKHSVYMEKGVFHFNGQSSPSGNELISVRHSYSAQNGQERIVFDFATNAIPQIYGLVAKTENKIYLDFFRTQLRPNLAIPDEGELIKALSIYPLTSDMLSLEIEFKRSPSFDIFYLQQPGRLVIDVK